jgi:hypothetical protein
MNCTIRYVQRKNIHHNNNNNNKRVERRFFRLIIHAKICHSCFHIYIRFQIYERKEMNNDICFAFRKINKEQYEKETKRTINPSNTLFNKYV